MIQTATRRRSPFALISARLFAFLAVLGPGFITANVDNDPGGILTYSQAGAEFGYQLLWTLIPTTIALIVVQEMAARMGAITGKGLSDLIREEFGLRATFFTMVVLGLADFFNIVSEFAGLASGMGIFGASKYIVVPIGAALVWIVIVRGRYKPVERLLIIASLIYFAYPVSAFLAKPNWDLAIKQTFVPVFNSNPAYLVMIVGLIGTTITPWMQFYLQAAVVEKGINRRNYPICRLDVITGCIFTEVIAFFIVVACGATIYHSHHPEITDVAQAAIALRPFAGKFASLLFAAGLINASLLSAAILPLATSYNVCEGLGFESGVDRRFSEAPIFYWLYTLLVGGGAAVVLIPGLPLLKFIIYSQVANGILLPFVLVYMILLINRPRLMGTFKNEPWQNFVAWTTAIIMIVLTAALIYTSLVG
ncbi:MAG: Nramp family divalent metal transporter [Acidobacteriaceae bacterium]|nr:Nramp family divalent metal transporter [Acidobacteriaceae bacterium]MBV9294966.1 Nramp family divalent metal transporter [Acidobacteriaceae bacterium]MBV9767822.1 Nramp family divalent metal transporter [Acidobacteriaceae bacterium]